MLVLALPDRGATSSGLARVDAVAERWARAESLGVVRDGGAYPVGAGDEDVRARKASLERLFRDGRATLGALARARSVAAIVTDADGVILSLCDGGAFGDRATRVRLVEGADWSERARGTNAIGTAIAEARAVGVLGAAHYEKRNAGLFCYAAPVFDPRGRLAAVIDVSGPLDRHDPAFAELVRTTAADVEASLRTLAYARAGLGNLAALARLVSRSSAPAMVIEPRGPVRIHNEAARAALLGDRRDVDCQAMFGMPFASLERLAREGSVTRFETRDAVFSVALDPLLDGDEGALGIVVHFDPWRKAPSVRPAPAASPVSAPAELPPSFAPVFGTDAALVAAKRAAATFAGTELPVLLLAETGTGKELFARAIHAASARASGPFVAINCGAVSPSLLESELFGHAPSAFTGASRTGAEGLLGAADGGTLFLDEIAEMPAALQAALLRALDDGSYRRVGETKPRHARFRLVGATCRDLGAMVERGEFRRDLFFRIHGACVRLPTLRARTDRVELARALLGRSGPELGPSAIAHLQRHGWPGNVRELKNALAHAAALGGAGPLEREHFPEPFFGAPVETRSRAEVLREAAAEAVRASEGNISEAARRLGVARDTLYRMLRSR